MHLKSFCFILPAEFDDLKVVDHRKFYKRSPKKPSNRRCGAPVVDFLHHLLKWVTVCHQEVPKNRFSGVFYDAEGVEVPENFNGENPRIFSYSELYIGSHGFSDKEMLGSGGFGRVFRAVLPSDGTVVAVKCLSEKGEHFKKSFMAELVAVAHLRHRNLVKLRGWCVHDDQLYLVYDYMPNRSLDRVLFRRQEEANSVLLTWERRKKIVYGLAAALNYLHEQLETQIIHRDVKTSNVMLDSHFNARLGDFGLARWLEHEVEYKVSNTPYRLKNRQFRLAETTRIGGTIGYIPPESLQRRGVATAKSDVFSFGIVVLEVISGRRAIDLTYNDDQIILLDWIRRLSDEGTVLQAGDSRLPDGAYKLADMERLIHIGLMCTLHEPQSRPSMKWILEAVSGNIYGKLPDLPSFQSHPFYISLPSSTNSITSTTNMRSSKSSKSSTTIGKKDMFYSSNFVTANGETIYMTAESQTSNTSSSFNRCHQQKCTFPIVETPRVITYEEIILATNNFSDSQRVAEVDFGTSYHGFVDGHHVLVKRLGMRTCPALRLRFSNEFQNLGRLRHRNLVQLRGWCTEQGEMLVVYDYSSNRLLSHILFHHGQRNRHLTVHWQQRYSIVKSLASAIYYLHEEWDEQVIHRNITSSAVVLDPDLNPRLGSFALAEFLTRNEDGHHVVVDRNKSIRGIFGYMSPEYMDSGEATTMADVYSFGVVLLEVVTGQMAVDFRQPEVLLVKRLHKYEAEKRSYEDIVDRRLNGEYNYRELVRLVKLGMACTRSNPELRPSMRQIVSILDGYDQWFKEINHKEERNEEWKQRNAPSLCLIRRIQTLGIQ